MEEKDVDTPEAYKQFSAFADEFTRLKILGWSDELASALKQFLLKGKISNRVKAAFMEDALQNGPEQIWSLFSIREWMWEHLEGLGLELYARSVEFTMRDVPAALKNTHFTWEAAELLFSVNRLSATRTKNFFVGHMRHEIVNEKFVMSMIEKRNMLKLEDEVICLHARRVFGFDSSVPDAWVLKSLGVEL